MIRRGEPWARREAGSKIPAPPRAARAGTGMDAPPHALFVSGERAQAGKSTCCIGILLGLLERGYLPSELAYIKPATQCTKTHLIARFAACAGIESVPIGPIVFRSGFTREFLRGRPSPGRPAAKGGSDTRQGRAQRRNRCLRTPRQHSRSWVQESGSCW